MEAAMDNLRVVLVEDCEFLRSGMRVALPAFGISVIGEAVDADGAETLVMRLAPAAVITGLFLRESSGIDATRRLTKVAPRSPVMVLTRSTEKEDVRSAVLAGARGYMLKDAREEAIAGAVHAVASGDSVVSSKIAHHLLEGIRTGAIQMEGAGVSESDIRAMLTDREIEVLKLIASGKENTEIAAALSVALDTVKHHISSILTKLHLENRTQAAVYAVRGGLV